MTAVRRTAAKVVLVDPDGRTLLFRGGDPARPQAGSWWFLPGGGVDDGEDITTAARREVHEETGLRLDDVGPVVVVRHTTFEFEGRTIESEEHHFVVGVDRFEVHHDGWTELERRSMFEHRWWTAAELRTTDETVYPEQLLELLEHHDGPDEGHPSAPA